MLQYDDKDLVKSSKINNSKEELIEEIKQKGKIELKNSINKKLNNNINRR